MNLLQVGIKNIWRNATRTIITASMVGFGVFAFILLHSLLLGFKNESLVNLQRYEYGDAQILQQKYFHHYIDKRERLLDAGVAYTPIAQALSNDYVMTARTYFQTEIIVYEEPYESDGSLMTYGVGISENDSTVFDLSQHIVSGTINQGKYDAVIGQVLADKLRAQVGYPVLLRTYTKNNAIQTIDLQIVGIVDSPDPIMNRYIYMSLAMVSDMLMMGDTVSEISLQLKHGQTVENLASVLRAHKIVDAQAYALSEVGQQEISFITAKTDITAIFIIFLLILSFIGITNTIMLSISERLPEIGIMRAMGFTRMHIMYLFIWEGCIIGLIGIMGGIFFGFVCNIFLVRYGIDYSWLFDKIDIDIAIKGIMYGVWRIADVFAMAGFTVVAVLLASVAPAWNASRRNVIAAIENKEL